MEERHIVEHFVVAGLPPENPEPLEEFTCDGATVKNDHSLPPITEIGVVNTLLGEEVPDGFTMITETPSGRSANLCLDMFRSSEMFLCYKRSLNQPPLVDIGVMYDGKEKVMVDSQVVQFTVGGRSASINTSGGNHTYITYRRSSQDPECNELVVSDICVKNKEPAPHSFCTIERNINRGSMMGSEVYLCYRKSVNRPTYIAYKPALLDICSPMSRKPSFSLPSDLALFCVPMGATLESWPPQTKVPEPVFSTFVLTVTSPHSDQVDKVYCAGVTFYERYDHEKLTPEQTSQLKLDEHCGINNLVYTNKSICLLSLWPFFDSFEMFLNYLYQMAHSGSHPVPIERYIYHLLEAVPFPSIQRPRILVQLDSRTCMNLTLPEDSPIALSGARFRDFISLLRPSACIQLLVFALTEQKVLLHSLRPAVLTAATEALAMIIFPFHWQCPYIPLCPLGLSSLLNAPIPFLLGLDSRFFDLYHPPQDVICVDLDTGAISIPEDKKAINEKLIPKRCVKLLKNSLERLCEECYHLDVQKEKVRSKPKVASGTGKAQVKDESGDEAFKIRRMEQELEVQIQEAFLTFTASLLQGYRSFLLPIATQNLSPDTANLFDIQGFVKSRDRSYQKFYSMLVSTQMFSKFIEERSFVSDKDASLAFFDECVEKFENYQNTGEPMGRLLEVEVGVSERTFVLPPPEPPPGTSPGTTWSYDRFPALDRSLFIPSSPQKATQLRPPAPANVSHPPSPMARRSKQEVRSAQKQATRLAQTPLTWAKCLVSTSYSVWYTQLASFALTHQHGSRVLHLAYRVLLHIQALAQHNTDEVSYRIMMQLCGVYGQPELAMKVLCAMNTVGITPNAITYGYYNRAVLECKWSRSYYYWRKLRNAVSGVAAFRSSGRDRMGRRATATCQATSSTSAVRQPALQPQQGAPRPPGDCRDAGLKQHDASPEQVHLPVVQDECSDSKDPNSTCDDAAQKQSGGIQDVSTDLASETTDPLSAGAPDGGSTAAGDPLTTPQQVVHSAGLVMTSPLDDAVFEPSQRHRSRPTDLAHALTPTLRNYDQMSEPSVPRPSDPGSNIPDYLRNAKTGGDGKIMNRLWSLASSYMPAAYADSTHSTPASSINNTPKRSLSKKDGPGERWERSVERWNNSPKMARSREKMNTHARNVLNRDLSASRKCHARSDSGSSLGSLSEICVGSQDTPNNTKVTGKTQDANTEPLCDPPASSDSASKDADVHASKNGSAHGALKHESDDLKKCDDTADGANKTDSESKIQASDNLSSIDEEDLSLQNNGQTRSFFSRNAPERLSSLFKKGVGGADEKLRGLWRRGVSKSGSKDSLRSNPSSSGSLVSSPSSEKTPCASPVENDPRTPVRSPKKKKSPQSFPGTKGSLRLTNNTTDKELFLKGEQPRLFQASSPEQYETPPSSPVKSKPQKVKNEPKSPHEPVIVSVCPGRDKVILGDPLGALDSPTNSPDVSPKSSKKPFDYSESASEGPVNSILVMEDDPTLRPAAILNHAKASFASRLNPDLNVQVSTVRRTVLPPLSGPLTESKDVKHPDESPEELSDALNHASRQATVPQSSSSSSSLSSDTAVMKPSVIPWSIVPIGSSFSVPVNSHLRSATIPRSSVEKSSPLKALPPLAPKTPSRVTPPSTGVQNRPSRSQHRQLNQQGGLKSSGRSNSVSSSSSQSVNCGADAAIDDEVGLRGESRRSSSGGGLTIAGRTSNSLTSLSSAAASDGVDEDSVPRRGHRRRGSDLAPRQAATLESNYTPSMWKQKLISDPSQQLNGAALTNLANSGLQKLGLFRENFLDPTVYELLGSRGFSGRKNELLSGGLSSLRSSAFSAVSSLSKKVRESMSTNNTPTRVGSSGGAVIAPGTVAPYTWRSVDGGVEEDDIVDGFFSRRRESAPCDPVTGAVVSSVSGSEELLMSHAIASSISAGGLFSSQGIHGGGDNTSQLFDTFSAGPAWEARGPYCLGVEITSCSKCHNCHTLLYDEEIMAGWTPDHSNLNTKCHYCERYTVPVLTITQYEMLHIPKNEAPGLESERRRSSAAAGDDNSTSRTSAGSMKEEVFKTIRSKCSEREPITVAYLSPLVLRKELESMLSQEGDDVLTQPSCPEKHPILYWNMLWYFTRLGLPSQLAGLCLAAKLATDGHLLHPSWCSDPSPRPPPGPGQADVNICAADKGVEEESSPRSPESASAQDLEGSKTGAASALNGNVDKVHGINDDTNSSVRQSSEVNVCLSNNLVSSESTTELPSNLVGLKSEPDSTPASDASETCSHPLKQPPSDSTLSTADATASQSEPKKCEDKQPHKGTRYPDWRNVFVICMWDCPLYHQEVGPPLYLQLRQRGSSSRQVRALVHQPLLIDENVLQSLLTLILIDDLPMAIKMFAQELRKRPTGLQQRRLPLYRDLLLLASDGLSHSALNMVSFEQRYRAAYDSLEPNIACLLTPADSAPPMAANFAKRCFPPLSL